MKRTFFLSLTSCLVIGCTTIKDASDPTALTEKNYYNFSDKKPIKTKQQLDLSIETLDPTKEYSLGEMIDIALVNNPSTKIYWEDAKQAAATYGQSLQNYFPQLSAEGSLARQKNLSFMGTSLPISWNTYYQGMLSVSYLIWDFGQLRASSNEAFYAFQNVDFMRNRQLQTVIQSVMNSYYNLLNQKELLEAKEQDVLNAKTSMEAAQEKLKTGVGSLGDFIQAKTSWLNNKLALTQQKQTLHTSTTKLINNLGTSPIEDISTQLFPKELPLISIESIDNLIAQAVKNRPDYQAALADVLSKEQAYQAAYRANYPTFSGSLDVGKTHSTQGTTSNYDFNLYLSLTLPLFQGFSIQNNVKKTKSAFKQSQSKAKQLKLNIERELSDYRTDIILSIEEYQDAGAYVESAQKDFDIQLSKYKAGTNTIVDVIQAQTSVANAQAKLIDAKRNYFVSLANLAYASGTLFHNNQEAP